VILVPALLVVADSMAPSHVSKEIRAAFDAATIKTMGEAPGGAGGPKPE
jgi:hypothetical protein